MDGDVTRCDWAGSDDLYIRYHDEEWGVPKTDDRVLFEKLVLEGFQAGLSWLTILRKRPRFRQVFDDFEPETIAGYGPSKIDALMADAGIVRNRLKIDSTISNAQAYLTLRHQQSFASYLWGFVDGRPIQNRFARMQDIPAQSALSQTISKDLKSRGFRFCGPTIVYAFMQATGMVNDHLTGCLRHEPCAAMARDFQPPTA